jgi:hypothetical protein
VRGYENVVFFSLQISNVFAAVIVYLTNSGSVSADITKILIYVLVALAGGVLVTFVTVAIAAMVLGPRKETPSSLLSKGELGNDERVHVDAAAGWDDDDLAPDGEGGNATSGAPTAFDWMDPRTWFGTWGDTAEPRADAPPSLGPRDVGVDIGSDDDAGGAAGVGAGAAAGGVAVGSASGAGELPPRAMLPRRVGTSVSPAVRPRAFEPPSALDKLLAAVGFAAAAGAVAPAPPDGLSDSSAMLAGVQDVAPFQRLLDETAVDFSGGADNRGLTHTRLEVVDVQRVLNRTVWKQFSAHAVLLSEQLLEEKRAVPEFGVATGALAGVLLGAPPAAGVNEIVAMHGTAPDLVQAVVNDGLDPRVGNFGGMFGPAIYLGENSSKADQYASPDADGVCSMFVVRAIVGSPFVAAQSVPFRRPPCIPAGHVGEACNHPKFDSVLAEIRANVPEATLVKHREICLYDRAKAYPAFLVRYRRV